ncbi:MAG: glycosyltransferase family 4 protein [Ignavibacteriota bacterium]|nr:glycosyltransferase family 1 protein [Ignavibacteriota bacterium]MCZ2270192.1 glycosyltransferase family 4 protein [Ignavibacteriales bacterium]QKJ98224.1 MAG: glycosyltransferase family 4 protein [Ignavibacteriota bacterium]HOJ07526.1 glycosyltransferase family 4 protein [Ignavibacteriaceae bacterium]
MNLKKTKVLILDSNVGNDYSLFLCKALKKADIDITLVVTEDNRRDSSVDFPILTLSPPKAKNVSKFKKIFKYYNYLLNVYKLISKEKYDVIHFQFFRRIRVESIYFAMLKLLGVRLAHTVHDVTPLNENKFDHLFNLLVYKTADVLFVHSNSNKRTLTQQIKLNEEKIKVVPHGDFDFLIPDKIPTKSQAREFFGLSQGDNVILFFGAIKEYKGLDILLNSLFIVAAKINNLAVIIAGRPDPVKLGLEYENIISKLPSKVKIIYHTQYIPDAEVVKYFIASDVAVLPYRRISHSGVLHLAYSFGRPVIATNVGDFKEFIEEDKSGFVLSSNNQENLSEKIIEAFSDKLRLEEMGKYARHLSESKYSWDSSAETMKQIYGKMTQNY